MTTPAVGDTILSVPAMNVDGKRIPVAVPTGIPKVGDTVTLIPTGGGQTKYAAAVTTTPAVGDIVALVPLQGGGQIKWAAVNGGTSSPAPAYRGKWGLGYRPFGIAVDSFGDIYVTDPDHALVWKYDPTGKFLLKWGSAGTGNGQFNQPMGIAADSVGGVYVADRGNNRIQKFTSTGTFLLKWGSYGGYGSAGGLFRNPNDVTAGPEGHLYVTDTNNDRIQVFTSTGGFIRTFWQDPYEATTYDYVSRINPDNITVGSDGNIYSTDWNGVYNITPGVPIYHVKVHSPTGAIILRFGDQFSWPRGITGDPQGNLYVVDAGNNRVQMFDLSGSLLASWGGFNFPFGVVVDLAGNVYVTDTNNRRIMRYVSGGTGWGTLPTKDMTYPIPICVYRVGNVDPADIADALAGIPSDLWTFAYSTTAAPGTDWNPEPNYGGLPWPVRDYALCIGSASEFSGMQAIGLGGPHRASVLTLAETTADLTQRIWHELLHGITGIENADTMHTSAGFVTWMTANHPGHPFLVNPAGYPDTTEILLYWDEYLTEQVRAL